MDDQREPAYETPLLQEIGGFADQTLGQGLQFPEGEDWLTI